MCVVLVIREKIMYHYGPFNSPNDAFAFIESHMVDFVGCEVSTYKLYGTDEYQPA